MDRLRQRADFLAVANGARANSAGFVLQGRLRDDDGPVRVGFTVTKKNGTATERNRIRRRLRELVKRLDVISMRPHHDYVLVGRRTALNRDFATMLDDLRSALGRLERQPKDQVTRPPRMSAKRPANMPAKTLESEAGTGGHQDNASKRDSRASRKPNE
jgi:ribonuclease P protein component